MQRFTVFTPYNTPYIVAVSARVVLSIALRDRWRPPHYQIACEYLSDPSEFLFVEGERGKNQMS